MLIWFLIGLVMTDGSVVALVDVIHVTHAAVATVTQVCFHRLRCARLLILSAGMVFKLSRL